MSVNSSSTIEMRSERQFEGALLKYLESKNGAYYIDYQDQCPLTHTSHRVGSNSKLCSPIYKEGPCTKGCSNKGRNLGRHNQSRLSGNISPYDPRNYNFSR